MKNLMASVSFFTLIIAAACNQPVKTETSATLKSWDFVITSNTTKQNLDSVSTAWAKDSIDLKFTRVVFDSLGKLSKITGTVYMTSMGKHVSGEFAEDSLSKKPQEILMDNRPSITLRGKK